MLMLLRQHPVISIASALLIGLLTWGFWPQPIMVETIAASQGPLTISIEEEGRTRLLDRYVIAAPIDGVTCKTQHDVGDSVTRGQVLLQISPLASQTLDARSRAQAKAQVAAAESALEAAKQQMLAADTAAQLAATELERLQPLVKQRLIAQDLFDRAQAEANSTAAALSSSTFNVDVAGHELEAAQTLLEYSAATSNQQPVERVSVRSPINGKILKVGHECESPVRTGDLLLEVGDPTVLEIEVDVLSTDAVKIKPGVKVVFDRWGGKQALEGIVRTIEPIAFTKVSALGVEEQRVLVISDFSSPRQQWERLGAGYRVDANFILWQQQNVLQLPSSSIFRHQGQWATFVVENNRAKRRTITIGQHNGLVAQIVTGIAEGEYVVNHPDDKIDDNVRVSVRRISTMNFDH